MLGPLPGMTFACWCHSFGERVKGGNVGPDLASVADRKAGAMGMHFIDIE